MNIIFLRHGQATDNVKELISDKEIYWSTLTEDGISTVKKSIENLNANIDKIYVSPLPRTIETASYLNKQDPKTEVIIDDRIREIYHGKYTHNKNNEDLDNTRIKQINGDYFIRLGEYGENNYDIESRLCFFLKDVYENNFKENTIMIVSHGSITSYMKRILKIKSPHIQTGKLEIFNNVSFKYLFEHIRKLKIIKNEKTRYRIQKVNELNTNNLLKKSLLSLAKNEFNNIEFNDEVFDRFIRGYKTNNLIQITNPNFDNGIILICFYSDFENFADYWMKHYISIGIKNYVLINNSSIDNSDRILQKYSSKVNISFWKINEKYNCYNMCGWKQRIFEYYGIGKTYLTVDSDELFIYKNYKNINVEKFVKNNNLNYIKALMLDVYTDKNLYEGTIEDYIYVDKNTYKMTSLNYGNRFYGGPRSRIFNINPSLQKVPFIKYTGKEVFSNDHFYYPFNINSRAKYCAYLLHYKFLFNTNKKYKNNIILYDKDISILIDNLDFKF